MAVEIATAYVSVIPSGRGFGAALNREIGPQVSDFGGRSGSMLGATVMAGVRRVGVGAALAVGAALTGALVKGWGRLTQIEDARASLRGLGHDGATIKTIMDNALASVKGTAFGLGDAATIAASTVAAGIKPGQDLRRVLGLVGDAATIAKTSIGEMGSIFNKVAAGNRLSMQEVNQLADRGIPIMQWLAKQYGVTADEARKMVERGEVDFAAFSNAFETNIAGAALKSGNTTNGAFANMGAAASRFGAALLGGVFPKLKEGFGNITQVLDRFTPAAARFGAAVADKIAPAVGFLASNFLPILGALGAALLFFAYTQLAAAVTSVTAFVVAAGGLGPAFALIGGPVILAGVLIAALVAGVIYAYQHFEVFRNVVDGVATFVTAKVGEMIAWIRANWAQFQEATTHVMNVVRDVITVVLTAVGFLWRMWGDDLVRVAKTIWNYIQETIQNALQVIRGVITLVLALINGDWGKAWDAIKSIVGAVWNQIGNIISTAVGLARGVITGFLSTVNTVFGSLVSAVAGMPSRIAAAASGMWDGIKNSFKAAINTIIGWWNNLSFQAPKVHIPGTNVDVGGFSIDTPNIPKLHSGGLFRALTPGGEGLAVLRDGERVLTPNQNAELARIMSSSAGIAGAGAAGRSVPLIHIDHAEFQDEVDLDILNARMAFAASAGSFA